MTLDLGGLGSLRIGDRERLARLVAIDAIIVVGASGAGKTTLVKAIRDARLANVDVPMRYATRPRRDGDDASETLHVTLAQFEAHVRDGLIGVHWVRSLDGGRTIRYGFRPAVPGALPVYSANNAIYATPAGVTPAGVLARALFVGVYAPDELRAARIPRRSPDLPPAEIAFRLADRAADIAAHVHLVIDNHGELEAVARAEIVQLIERIAADRVP